MAEGTPEDVAKVKESYTGQYLKELLGRRARQRAREEGGGGVARACERCYSQTSRAE